MALLSGDTFASNVAEVILNVDEEITVKAPPCDCA